MADDKIKLGVLWKNTGRDGKTPYLSGRVQQDSLDAAVAQMRDGGRLLILKNTKRPDKRDPDCVLYVVPERSQAPAPPSAAAPAPAPQRSRR